MLNANAPLVASRQLVFLSVQTGNAGWVDWQNTGRAGCQIEARIVQFDWPRRVHLQTKWNVRASIVHIVALNPLVHDSESATDHGLPVACEVVSEAEARTEGCPVVVYEPLRYAILPGNPDTIQVEGNAGENRVWTRAKSRAGRVDRTVWIE